MIFPIKGKYVIVSLYDELRPWNPKPGQKQYRHEAWDICAKKGEPIIAPENGVLFYHQLKRDDTRTFYQLFWPTHTSRKMFNRDWVPYLFSNKYDDGQDHGYGCCVILYGDSGITHFMAHIEEDDMRMYCEEHGVKITKKRFRANGDNVGHVGNPPGTLEVILNLDYPFPINSGDIIGYVGNRGFSTEPHIHYSQWRAGLRIDPALTKWDSNWKDRVM